MKITDLKCAVIGTHPVVRITTDEGIDGLGQVEWFKPYLKPHIMMYRERILGQDPTDVERVMTRIRPYGAYKPWGSAVSAIEIALWDIAGKTLNTPVYKLLGGKVRDRVRVYNGGFRPPLNGHSPQDYAENTQQMKERPEGFTIIKQPLAFHGRMGDEVPNFSYADPPRHAGFDEGGLLTERGLDHLVACVEAMKGVLGKDIGLALDLGPGMTVVDAIRLGKALEPMNVMWLEDMLSGNYTPYVLADEYLKVSSATSTPIHTGEQIYGRQNVKELFEKQAVDVIGPDPLDVGGIAETKWIAEYAQLNGILIAPHGIGDGLIGLAAHVQLAATLPRNYIAFEYPMARPEWWADIVEGLPDPIVKDGMIDVWDRPGLGVTFNVREAKKRLNDEDRGFFDQGG